MENYRKLIIDSLKNIKGFQFKENPYLNDDKDNILVEWNDANFLIFFNPSYEGKRLEIIKSLEAPFGVYLPVFENINFSSLPILDKYRIANHVNDKNLSLAKVSYRERIDTFLIGSQYYPMLEQLNEFKSDYSAFIKKGAPFIILSLLTMCMESSKQLANEIERYNKDPKKYLKNMEE